MKSKHAGKLAAAAVCALAVLAFAVPMAQAATPKPGYTQFTGCPTTAEDPLISTCIRSVVKSGTFNMGNKEVPITTPITIVGGTDPELGNFAANAQGGMSKSKQKVPGGVIGLTGLTWLLEFLGSEALTLYAVTEPVGVPTFGGSENITLPIRVHLENGTLGNNCYVGSPSSPITLHLTTGTTSPPAPNKPISGKQPTLSEDAKEIFHLENGTYVDNSFSAPGASGCVLTLFGFIPISINGLVNTASGLPAKAGTNTTIQNIDTEFVEIGLVY
jgi:hypothetical protein